MGCNASKLPPNTVVEPTSVSPRKSPNERNSPAKTISDESFLNRLDDCLDSSNFDNMKENNSFKSPESSQMKKTNIVKSRKVVSISISPVGSQSSSLNESLNSFETKILFEETEDSRHDTFENNTNSLHCTKRNNEKPITRTVNVEMPTNENESVPFHNIQRGRTLKLFDKPTPTNQLMSKENIYSLSSLKYIDNDVEHILESTIQSARKIQRRAEEYLSSSHLDVQINFDQIDTGTKKSIRKLKGHNGRTKLAASSETSYIQKETASDKIASYIAPHIEERPQSDAEEQPKQNYLDDFKVSDLSIISKASPYTPKHPSKKLHRVLGNLIADDNCMATRISNAREKYLKERQKRIQMEKMISARAYFSPKSRIRKTPHSYIGKRNVTLRELR